MVLKFWEPQDPFMLLEIIENIEELDIYDLRNWQLKKNYVNLFGDSNNKLRGQHTFM